MFGEWSALEFVLGQPSVGVFVEVVIFGATTRLAGSRPCFAGLVGDKTCSRLAQLFLVKIAVLVGVELFEELGDLPFGLRLANPAIFVGVHLFEKAFDHSVDHGIGRRIL